MLTIQLDMLQTAALAMILFLIGRFTVSMWPSSSAAAFPHL